MELVEPLERINETLLREYGKWTDERPRFRVTWSENQRECRKMTHTDEGLLLLHPEVREVRKYSHIKDRYVLEQLSVVPDVNDNDLVTALSYEPLWTFEDRHGNYLPPRFDACKLIITALYHNLENSHFKKYDEGDVEENRRKELEDTEKYLFGDDTAISDALGTRQGVIVPENKLLNEVVKE